MGIDTIRKIRSPTKSVFHKQEKKIEAKKSEIMG